MNLILDHWDNHAVPIRACAKKPETITNYGTCACDGFTCHHSLLHHQCLRISCIIIITNIYRFVIVFPIFQIAGLKQDKINLTNDYERVCKYSESHSMHMKFEKVCSYSVITILQYYISVVLVPQQKF